MSRERFERFADIQEICSRPLVTLDLVRMMCGDKIGEGAYRAVYEFDMLPNSVIKVAVDENANLLEWHVWQTMKDTPHAKWMAPCLHISPCGHFLVQRRVKPIPEGARLPKRIPDAFEDIKRSNWGMIGKQLVCHDYQFIGRSLDIAFAGTRPLKFTS